MAKKVPCQFCEGRAVEGEYFLTMELQYVYPLPAINLTTGTIDKKAKPPYATLAVFDDEEQIDSFKIRFCPLCGEKLMRKENQI